MKDEFKKTRSSLLHLAKRIEKGDYPHNRKNWGDAGVVITSKKPKPTEGGFYPDPRYVVTPFSRDTTAICCERGGSVRKVRHSHADYIRLKTIKRFVI